MFAHQIPHFHIGDVFRAFGGGDGYGIIYAIKWDNYEKLDKYHI